MRVRSAEDYNIGDDVMLVLLQMRLEFTIACLGGS